MGVPFHKPYLDNREIEAVTKALKRNLIGSGPIVASFEKEFKNYIGASNAIAVNSATAALHLAIDSLGIGPEDEVITTAFTFTSTILAIIYTGATPVLADIDSNTLCIDPRDIERKITKKTKAILPVHYSGVSCNMDEIIRICKKYNLALVEDAAHALPTYWKGKLIGSDNLEVKNIVCFSFQATKTLSIGDGGMITTSNTELAEKIKMKRLFGMKKKQDFSNIDMALQYGVEVLGYKYNMTDIEASIGKVQLKKLEEMNLLREKAAGKYYEKLSDVEEISLPYIAEEAKVPWHLFVIRLKDNEKRNKLLEYLTDRGIKASVHFMPVYKFPYFHDKFPKAEEELLNTEAISQEILSLPMFPGITDEEIECVCNEIKNFFRISN